MHSVQELRLRVSAKLERAPLAPIILDVPGFILLTGPSTAPVDPAMIQLGPSLVPTNHSMASIILPQTSQSSFSL